MYIFFIIFLYINWSVRLDHLTSTLFSSLLFWNIWVLELEACSHLVLASLYDYLVLWMLMWVHDSCNNYFFFLQRSFLLSSCNVFLVKNQAHRLDKHKLKYITGNGNYTYYVQMRSNKQIHLMEFIHLNSRIQGLKTGENLPPACKQQQLVLSNRRHTRVVPVWWSWNASMHLVSGCPLKNSKQVCAWACMHAVLVGTCHTLSFEEPHHSLGSNGNT